MEIPPRVHMVRRVRAALAAPFSSPLYLYGPPSTGKRSTLRAAAGDRGRCVTIDCVLNHTERQLFTKIAESEQNVSDASMLIHLLRTAAAEPTHDDIANNKNDNATATTTDPDHDNVDINTDNNLHILIFNRAERLSPAAFPLLFRLPSLCGRADIRIVFASRVPYASLRYLLISGGPGVGNAHGHPVSMPTVLFFTPLSQTEIVDALAVSFRKHNQIAAKPAHANNNNKNSNIPALKEKTKIEQIYTGFAKSVVTILYRTSNNPFHLQRVTEALFPEYLTILQEHQNPIAAFNRVRDRLGDTLTALTMDFAATSNGNINNKQNDDEQQQHTNMQQDDKTTGLSRTARTLLVAAFLGRVIAPSHDVRHFSAERTGRRAAAQKTEGNNAIPLERLLAIYHAIRPQGPLIEDDGNGRGGIDLTADSIFLSTCYMDNCIDDDDDNEARNLSVTGAISTAALVHLSTLIALGWLSRDASNNDISLSEPKYRCKLSRSDAIRIATSLDISIHDYLVFESQSHK